MSKASPTGQQNAKEAHVTTDTTPTVNRRNLRHGLRTAALLPWEDEFEHVQLINEVEGYLRPTTPAEVEIVRHFAEIMWRLRRVAQAEAAQFAVAQRRAVAWKAQTFTRPPRWEAQSTPASVVDVGEATLTGITSANMALIERYEASLQRAARRQLFLLGAIRSLRGGQPVAHVAVAELPTEGPLKGA